MKIVNVKKFVRSILIILGIIFVVSLILTKSTYSHGEKEYKTIYVSCGDTLWNIAKTESKTNSYYKDKDIRNIINDIMKENNLNDSTLSIDQKLIVPVA